MSAVEINQQQLAVAQTVFVYGRLLAIYRKDIAMDIVKVKEALDTLEKLLNDNDMEQLKRNVGNAVIRFQEDKAEVRYRDDLLVLNIDMKLDVNEADFTDPPF